MLYPNGISCAQALARLVFRLGFFFGLLGCAKGLEKEELGEIHVTQDLQGFLGPLQDQIGHVEVGGLRQAVGQDIEDRGGWLQNSLKLTHQGPSNGRDQNHKDQLKGEIPPLQLVLGISIGFQAEKGLKNEHQNRGQQGQEQG